MSDLKVSLTKRQIAFIIELVEIEVQNEAIKYFGELLLKEGLKLSDMGLVVDRLMKRRK